MYSPLLSKSDSPQFGQTYMTLSRYSALFLCTNRPSALASSTYSSPQMSLYSSSSLMPAYSSGSSTLETPAVILPRRLTLLQRGWTPYPPSILKKATGNPILRTSETTDGLM